MNKVEFARKLRREQTEVEKRFWSKVRGRQFLNLKFKRQVPIGKYIADFVCESEKLIIELDGGQHDEQREQDNERSEYLRNYGYRVVRFWNTDVIENLDGVLSEIGLMVGDAG